MNILQEYENWRRQLVIVWLGLYATLYTKYRALPEPRPNERQWDADNNHWTIFNQLLDGTHPQVIRDFEGITPPEQWPTWARESSQLIRMVDPTRTCRGTLERLLCITGYWTQAPPDNIIQLAVQLHNYL